MDLLDLLLTSLIDLKQLGVFLKSVEEIDSLVFEHGSVVSLKVFDF